LISTNQFKNGNHIEIDGKIWKIIEFQHVKPGKGGAFVRTKLRRIEDGSVIDKTFRAGEKFRPVHTESRKMQYLYDSGEAAVFMDSRDYEQIEIPTGALGDAMQWVLPNSEVEVLFVDEQASDVQVGGAIEMKVTQTPPPVAATSRRRWSPAWSSRCRSSSTRAKRSGSTPAPASTSPAPEPIGRCPGPAGRDPSLATGKTGRMNRCADPNNAATPFSPATSGTSPGVRWRS
jgi:elongation factor P